MPNQIVSAAISRRWFSEIESNANIKEIWKENKKKTNGENEANS